MWFMMCAIAGILDLAAAPETLDKMLKPWSAGVLTEKEYRRNKGVHCSIHALPSLILRAAPSPWNLTGQVRTIHWYIMLSFIIQRNCARN